MRVASALAALLLLACEYGRAHADTTIFGTVTIGAGSTTVNWYGPNSSIQPGVSPSAVSGTLNVLPGQSNAAGCSAGSDCTSGFCVQGVCCNSSCTGGCASCTQSGQLGTCTAVAAGTASRLCGAYLCDGANMSCPTSCSANTSCASGTSCSNGACLASAPNGGLANGTRCSTSTQCSSGYCAGGAVCATPYSSTNCQ